MKRTELTYRILPALVLFVVALVVSCSPNRIKSQETNYRYDSKINEINPKYLVYHVNDTLSYLYLEIETKELLYVRESSVKPFEAEVRLNYQIFKDYRGKILIDSASKVLYDYKSEAKSKKILGRVPLRMNLGENGVLRIVARDINKRVKVEEVIEINKIDRNSEQFFLIKNKNTGAVCFDNYFTRNSDLRVTSDFNSSETYFVDYFNTSFPPSVPPFSKNRIVKIPETKDSSFLLSFENKEGDLTLDGQGSYFIRPFDSAGYSIVFQKLDKNFDGFYNYTGMIEPLKYICTSKEYEKLSSSIDKRKSVEDFWIKLCGSKERAKVIIEEYYRRVELANKFFTSYKEGWKTDRGMLSIVMGLPNTIYKTSGGETWIYGSPHNMMMSLTFNFNRENTDRSVNDYQLIRYRTYRDYWYRACESWRQGRIFNFN